MSLLLGDRIKKEILAGKIFAEPYNEQNVSVNSVDVTLNKKLKTYVPLEIYTNKYGHKIVRTIEFLDFIDMKQDNKVYEIDIPEEGLILIPGILYLGSTNEKLGSDYFVPMYEGRSSMARLGIQSHISAGFGDLGFKSNWTLEINVIHPIKIYPNIRIGQVFFHEVEITEETKKYSGKYTEQSEAQASKSFIDFQ